MIFVFQKPVYMFIRRHTRIKQWLREKLSDCVFARQF
jgi:hypothetical protein